MDSVKSEKEKIETARKEIEGTRNEINIRLQQRDNALFGYLAAVAVLGGVAFGQDFNIGILLIIPFLTLAVAAIVAQHNTIIGRREAFIAKHLIPFLKIREAEAPFKEGTQVDEKYARREIRMRTLAHVIGLLIPAIVSLYVNVDNIWDIGWWAACFCLFAAIWLVWNSHKDRMISAKVTEEACLEVGVTASHSKKKQAETED